MRKWLKRYIAAVLVAILTVVCTNVTEVGAASQTWKEAYKKILNNWKLVENYSNAGTDYLKQYFGKDYGFDRYFLEDVNGDKTPELFLSSTSMGGLTVVFTYRDGKVVCLGCDLFYKINTSKKVLVVSGHWHGSGGSGSDEYSIYSIGKKELKQKYYIDYLYDKYTVWNSNWEKAKNSKSTYKKVYKKYVKGGKLFYKYKQYKLLSKKGLNKF